MPVPDIWADNSPKYQQDANGKDILGKDGKPLPAIKQQDRQVVADDLDKAKNTNAVELASLTALKVGVGDPYPAWKADEKGNTIVKDGIQIPDPFVLSYKPTDAVSGAGTAKDPTTFNYHTSATSVVAAHGFGPIMIQACIAILILVGFESVTAMGEEAKNAEERHARAVLLSLAIQGIFCYFIEYFAANYFLNSGYTLTNGRRFRRADRRHDGSRRHVAVRQLLRGPGVHAGAGVTVFLALIGTTLSCMSTGARVTYAMGRDEEVRIPFRHGARQEPVAASRHLDAGDHLGVIGIVRQWCYLGGAMPPAPLGKVS